MNDLFTEPPPRRKVSIEEQITAVNREISLREAVYAKQIIAGKLSQVKAEKQIGDMRAVLATLKWVRDHSEEIREVHRQTNNQPKECDETGH